MNAENKQKYWLERIGILLILLAFAASQYALRMNMFVYSDDAVAVEDMSNMTRLEYYRYICQHLFSTGIGICFVLCSVVCHSVDM